MYFFMILALDMTEMNMTHDARQNIMIYRLKRLAYLSIARFSLVHVLQKRMRVGGGANGMMLVLLYGHHGPLQCT